MYPSFVGQDRYLCRRCCQSLLPQLHLLNSSPDLKDYILNFHGIEALVDALNTQFSSTFKAQTFQNFTVRGEPAGLFKNAGTFSYVRFFGAGHEVPAYKVRIKLNTFPRDLNDSNCHIP